MKKKTALPEMPEPQFTSSMIPARWKTYLLATREAIRQSHEASGIFDQEFVLRFGEEEEDPETGADQEDEWGRIWGFLGGNGPNHSFDVFEAELLALTGRAWPGTGGRLSDKVFVELFSTHRDLHKRAIVFATKASKDFEKRYRIGTGRDYDDWLDGVCPLELETLHQRWVDAGVMVQWLSVKYRPLLDSVVRHDKGEWVAQWANSDEPDKTLNLPSILKDCSRPDLTPGNFLTPEQRYQLRVELRRASPGEHWEKEKQAATSPR